MLSERIKLDRGFPLCVAGPSPGAQRGSGGGRGERNTEEVEGKAQTSFRKRGPV